MVYREQILNIYKDMKKQMKQFIKERDSLPEGYINPRRVKGRPYYNWLIPKGGRRKKVFRKGITRNKEKINQLVRKRYLDGAIANIEEDLNLIKDLLENYKRIDEAVVLADFLKKYPELQGGIYYGNMSNEEWATNYRQVVGLYEKDLKSTAPDGRSMRSYGELIIASRLDFYGIPYRYEEGINYKGVYRVPDFKIRRPKDRKLFYWEHMGKITDEVYLDDNITKLKEYASIGITPWDNLIITFAQEDGGIDVKRIDAMIKGWLL